MNEQLAKVIAATYIKYKGCIIEKDGNEFVVLNRFKHDTLESAQTHIDLTLQLLRRSICSKK